MKKQILETFYRMGIDIKAVDTSTDEQVYKLLYPAESIEKKAFYNIGAGRFNHPCWTNVDGESEWYGNLNKPQATGITFDMFAHQPLKVADYSAELIYTSHTIEHADNESVQYLFNDCFRMLKKGGVFRIVTPHTENAYRAWRRGDRAYFYWSEWDSLNVDFERLCLKLPLREATLSQIFLDDFASAAAEITTVGNEKRISDTELEKLFNELPFDKAMDYCISLCSIDDQRKYPFRHMNWFNDDKLITMLKKAGFTSVTKSAYLQSDAPVLRNAKYFDQTLPKVSLYFEASK